MTQLYGRAPKGPVMQGLSPIPNIGGLLITMPHKFARSASVPPARSGRGCWKVVGVIRRNADGSWHGDLLDGLAFVKAGAEPDGVRILLIGAGGAGSAIAIALLEAGVRELVICDVDETRTAVLIELLSLIKPADG